MSSTSVNSSVQQLYDQVFRNSGLQPGSLKGATPSQLNQLAKTSIADQQISGLLGASADSASLSSTATSALLQEINPTTSTSLESTLANAVQTALLARGTEAESKYLSSSSATVANGTHVNVTG